MDGLLTVGDQGAGMKVMGGGARSEALHYWKLPSQASGAGMGGWSFQRTQSSEC